VDDEAYACYLARFSKKPCNGRIVKAHLIPRRHLRQQFHRLRRLGVDLPWANAQELIDDPATWVPACGGVVGNSGHHGELDFSRTLRVPWSAIPDRTKALAALLRLDWWLEREYRE
jgi:hypothetical protein